MCCRSIGPAVRRSTVLDSCLKVFAMCISTHAAMPAAHQRAKPDALSATANAHVRAPTPSSGALPSNVLPSAPLSVLPTPNAPPPFNMSRPATALPSPNTIPPLNVPHPAALTPTSDPAWGAQALPPVPRHPHAAAFTLPPHAPPPREPALIPAANFHRVT